MRNTSKLKSLDPTERNHFGDLGANPRIIVNNIFDNRMQGFGTGFMWITMGFSDGLL
jgi:hypothetical protein